MKSGVKVLIIIPGVALSFLTVVWMRTLVVQSGYRVASLREKLQGLDLELAQMEFKLAQIQFYKITAIKAREQGYRLPTDYPVAEKLRVMP
ncbi:MAG: hypothetical protein HY547_00270 [Elusimicrobia bacterium]|nr:hypothetical protein [Elusimicrobiota bacterium]